jgi:hypothetical protein
MMRIERRVTKAFFVNCIGSVWIAAKEFVMTMEDCSWVYTWAVDLLRARSANGIPYFPIHVAICTRDFDPEKQIQFFREQWQTVTLDPEFDGFFQSISPETKYDLAKKNVLGWDLNGWCLSEFNFPEIESSKTSKKGTVNVCTE